MSIARPVKKTFAARTRAGKTPLQRKIALLRAGKENGGAQKAAAQHKAFGVPQRLAILPAASIAFRLRVCYNNLYIVKKQGEPEMEEQKKRILSGIQPTGTFTLGNYVGAVRNWDALQSDYNCIYMIANMHAITVRQTPATCAARRGRLRRCCWLAASTRTGACCSYRAMCPLMRSCRGCSPAARPSAS